MIAMTTNNSINVKPARRERDIGNSLEEEPWKMNRRLRNQSPPERAGRRGQRDMGVAGRRPWMTIDGSVKRRCPDGGARTASQLRPDSQSDQRPPAENAALT
jgi:hypothetical protein